MNIKSNFTYILRRWDDQENQAGQIVVITSSKRLTPQKLRMRLECVTLYPPEEFVEIYIETDASMVLDTWERGIETDQPKDMDFVAVKAYRNWWKQEMLESHMEGEE